MLFYGIELSGGSELKNLVAEQIPKLNSVGVVIESLETLADDMNASDVGPLAYKGRLVFNTATNALMMWTGANWITAVSADSSVVQSFEGRTGNVTLQKADLVGLIDATNLPKATTTVLGAIKVGAGLATDINGVLSVSASSGDLTSGTRMLFDQAAAPTGWVQDTNVNLNDRMLRVVNTAGAGSGGVHSPILMDKVPSHTHTTNPVSTATSPVANHTHVYMDRLFAESSVNGGGLWTTIPSGGGSGDTDNDNDTARYVNDNTHPAGGHSHTVDIPATTSSANTGAAVWQPRYLNVIICTKT